ncbi:MAG: hypothetical protein ACM31C_29715 [Acidobacteriota bacterium]
MPRALCCVALAACFTPHTAADAPRARAYNALVIAAGAAAAAGGYAIAHGASDTDGAGPFVVATFGGGGMLGGAFLVAGGLAGLVLAGLDYTPAHGTASAR